jgi:hypothetical protein
MLSATTGMTTDTMLRLRRPNVIIENLLEGTVALLTGRITRGCRQTLAKTLGSGMAI